MTDARKSDDLQAATDRVITVADDLAAKLRHSSRNLEIATELLLLLMSDRGHDAPPD